MGLFSFFKKKSAKNNAENQEQLVENKDELLEKEQENVQEQAQENEQAEKQEAEQVVEQQEAVADEAIAQEVSTSKEQSDSEVKPVESVETVETQEQEEPVEVVEEAQEADNSQVETESNTDTTAQDTIQENEDTATEDTPVAETEAPSDDEATTSSTEETPTEEAPAEAPVKVKRSFFERLKRTRENIAFGIEAMIKGKKISEELYEDLETALLTADLGVDTTERVIEQLRENSKLRDLHDAGALKNNLKQILCEILRPCAIPLDVKKNGNTPYVILMVGVNGAGKTTTIGKLALKFKSQGLKVMLAAGDTFRAAAVEQLVKWGERTDVPVISQPTGSDSASVIFDALTAAKSRGCDVLICDTAGRLQNKDHLMDELKKIVRVMKKNDANVPDEVMLVLDGATGQNAVSQTRIFNEAVKITGITITKLDGTAKGGVVFALADQFKIPLRFIGIGEKTEDLREFDVEAFVDALFGE